MQEIIVLSRRFAISLIVIALLPLAAFAYGGIPFVQTNGDLNRREISDFRVQALQRRHEIRRNIEANERREGSDEDKIQKKIKKNKTLMFFDIELEWLARLETTADVSTRIEIARKIAELDLALKSDIDPENTLTQIIKHIRTYNEDVAISKTAAPLGEASNLINPSTGRVFSAREIREMKARGVDLSVYDPPADNGVLENIRDVSATSPRRRYFEAQNPFHAGLTLPFPDQPIVHFDEVRKKQSKPKLTVFVKTKDGKKQEFKLKLTTELHGEPTSAALSNALGIYTDVGRYFRDVKMILGKKSYDEFKLEWNSYYGHENIDRLVRKKGRDENGNYVIFTDGFLEPELDEDVLKRAGPWYWGAADHKSRREFRGLLLFNIWIHNTDLKEGENNKLVLKSRGNGEHELYYLQQDLGFSFGRTFRERPTDYQWNIISSESPESVIFAYRNFQPNSGFEHVTWADARWMVRKIAQLSRRQIEEAVAIGNWPNKAPYDYRSLIVEKLIARRNQLVKAFGLEGAQTPSGRIALLPVDRSVEERAKPAPQSGLPGTTVDFSPEVKAMIVDPIVRSLHEMVRTNAISLLGEVDNMSVEPSWFGWDDGVISQVVINLNRKIVKNPNPKSLDESYIVRDDFKLGARLGLGLVTSGDVAYVRGFSLIYPVATKEQGFDAPRHFDAIFRHGYDKIQSKLPRRHVLLTESYLEGRGRLQIDGGQPVTIGTDLTFSRFDLSRSLISRKNPRKILFFEDESVYTELAARIYTKLVFFKIHHFKASIRSGTLERNAYELDAEGSTYANRALFANDFAEIKRRGAHKRITTNFWHESTKINIFGYWQREKELRRDLVDIWTVSAKGQQTNHQKKLIVEMSAEEKWRTTLNGEEHFKNVRFTSGIDRTSGKPLEPAMKLSFSHIDRNATNGELETGYLPFIDGVAGVRNFLNFTPRLHAVQDGWGELNVRTDLEIYEGGVARLFEVNEARFKSAMMSVLHLTGSDIALYSPISDNSPSRGVPFFGKTYGIVEMKLASENFLYYWRQVKAAQGLTAKAEALVNALYKAASPNGDSYQPVIFRALAKIVGEDELFMEAHITVPDGIENKLPGKATPYNRIGTQKKSSRDRNRLLFDMSESLEVYQAF